ncbi:hypothetical protein TNCV_583101 [Trichonephila clavipes]|nr:hypothetical protein TNCV_583101 [Trichonephila clavipes]
MKQQLQDKTKEIGLWKVLEESLRVAVAFPKEACSILMRSRDVTGHIFSLYFHIKREPGTRCMLSNVPEIEHYHCGGLESCTPHAFKRGTVAAVEYWDEVLGPYVHLFVGVNDPGFI